MLNGDWVIHKFFIHFASAKVIRLTTSKIVTDTILI